MTIKYWPQAGACRIEKKQQTSFQGRINQLQHQNAELTKERDELLSHCEELRLNLGWYIETLDTVENLYHTPKQNALRNRAYKAFKATP